MDPVHLAQCPGSVRDHDGDVVGPDAVQLGEYLPLRLRINAGGRLVEDPHTGIAQVDASQGDALPLTTGQADTAPLLPELGVEPLRQGPYEVRCVGAGEGLPQLGVGDRVVTAAECDRVTAAQLVPSELLGEQAEPCQPLRLVEGVGVDTVQLDAAGVRSDDAEQSVDRRRLVDVSGLTDVPTRWRWSS